MSRVRGTNTSAERLVFCYLRKERIYFQRHYRKVSGSPDIALPRKKLCVFVDGDFWHGRRIGSTYHKLTPFWKDKILANIKRDKRNKRKLRSLGWKAMRIWESDLKKDPSGTLGKIKAFLTDKGVRRIRKTTKHEG